MASPPDVSSSGQETTTASEPSQGSGGGDISGRPALTRRKLFEKSDKGKDAGDGDSDGSPKGKTAAVPKAPKPKGIPRSKLSTAAKSKAAKKPVKKTEDDGKGGARTVVKKSPSVAQLPPASGTPTSTPERSDSAALKMTESKDDLSNALNRANTADHLNETEKATKEKKKEEKTKKKLKKRDKAVHARKMRFYRSLDSAVLRIFFNIETSMIFGSCHVCLHAIVCQNNACVRVGGVIPAMLCHF